MTLSGMALIQTISLISRGSFGKRAKLVAAMVNVPRIFVQSLVEGGAARAGNSAECTKNSGTTDGKVTQQEQSRDNCPKQCCSILAERRKQMPGSVFGVTIDRSSIHRKANEVKTSSSQTTAKTEGRRFA